MRPSPNPLAAPAAVGAVTAVLISSGPAYAGSHRVRRGETLSGIASRYGVSVHQLATANRLGDPNFIRAGERLRIPGGGGTVAAPGPRMHRVSSGENLSTIAARYGVSVDALARANRLADPNLIVSGSRLRIPRGAGALASRSTSTVSSAPPAAGGIEGILESQAAAHGVDQSLVKAVAWQESGWQQDVVSSAGAIGVMQVMPDTADFVNESLGGGNLNVRKADDNVALGVKYLDHVIDQMPSEEHGLAAYYTGPGNVHERLSETQRQYVRSVEALKSRFQR